MNTLGKAGEALAARHLQEAGYLLLGHNVRTPDGEIDLVALDPHGPNDELVFCEVKTRRSRRWGEPAEAVDGPKQRRLRAAAACYLRANADALTGIDVRFDVVEVLVERSIPRINHLRDAF